MTQEKKFEQLCINNSLNGFSHPERRQGEVYMGNCTEASFEKVGRKGKRLGTQAYSANGEPVDEYCPLYPLFVDGLDYLTSVSANGGALL